jgi:hypothetical protein
MVILLNGAVIVFVAAADNPPASTDGHVEYPVCLCGRRSSIESGSG